MLLDKILPSKASEPPSALPAPVVEPASIYNVALSYAASGWPVFPIVPGKKTDEFIKDASTDRYFLMGQFRARYPNAGIAVATGVKSGLIALAVRPGDGDDNLLALIAEEEDLPDEVLQTISEEHGRQLLFKIPEFSGPLATRTIAPGLRVQCESGFVRLPPGHAEWVEGHCPEDFELSTPPVWLSRRMCRGTAIHLKE